MHAIKKYKKQNGFTIVELLIVIVIIGILAALVIVAYTGIQDRAKKTRNLTDAQAIVKKAEAYAADNGAGAYPATAANFDSDEVSKLGSSLSVIPTTTAISTNLATNGVGGGSGYKIFSCGSAAQGLRVYYYDPTKPTTDAAVFSDAGTCL